MSLTKPDKPAVLFALLDCNNFYASCERVFNPRLRGKAVVILSNNDGCVIARSNEAKALGIPMGAPFFKYADLLKRHRVAVFSSNYTLYGQMSQRVMRTLAPFAPDLEIYSIDEAFFSLLDTPSLYSDAAQIKQVVYQWTGIPVSIGIAGTKTLAKAANRYAKKYLPEKGCFIINDASIREKILIDMPVEDVWGIGRQLKERLARKGIRTAWEFACMDDDWVKKNLSVVGLRTVWELRGISCLSLEEEASPKKSIMSSKSFGSDVYAIEDLAEALSSYTASAAERLRDQNSLASFLEVFIHTSRFKEEYYSNAVHITLPVPSDFTPHLIQFAKSGLQKIYKKGCPYKKIGVMLGGIVSNEALQQDLFVENKIPDPRHRIIMELMDRTNAKYGKDTLKMAAQGILQPWKARRNKCTSKFTTSWDHLLKIDI
ncbi:MAG: Y-family DNA polymerase [Candidatus Protochlamydia sp.]|nr:Y-family DNA polymerase [Candidatus Protochlamydia sp.]